MADVDRDTEDERAHVAQWKTQIKLCEREFRQWEKRSKKIVKRYRDDRGQKDDGRRRMNLLWSNIQTLMPSVYGRQPVPIAERRFLDADPVGRVASQILERAMRYQMTDSCFHPTVKRGVLDYLLVGRGQAWLRYVPVMGPASSVQETGDVEETTQDSEAAPIRSNDDDDYDESKEPEGESEGERVVYESVYVDYVNWDDFFTFPAKARTWEEIEGVGKRVYLSRDELIERFGKKKGAAVPLDHQPEGLSGQGSNLGSDGANKGELDKATVYEIWHKPTRTVCYIAKEYELYLDEIDDPLGLEGFWPCPRPLFATMTNDTLVPVPDYLEYQDQAQEIDQLTQRIDLLMKALKVAGVYDSSAKGLSRLLDEGSENMLIPVDSWAAFAEKGGLNGAISFLPIDQIAKVLIQLFEARDKIKQDLHEITGIADILRGQGDPNETATAQRIKGRFGTIRLKDRQEAVASYCRDIIALMGEIIAEHFSTETLILVSGVMNDDGIGPALPPPPEPPATPVPGMAVGNPAQQPMGASPVGPSGLGGTGAPGQQMPVPAAPNGAGMPSGMNGLPMQPLQMQMLQWQMEVAKAKQEKQALIMAAIDLLRQDKLRGFRIDIETDTTIADSAEDEKQSRVEFVTAASGFLKQAMEAGQAYPKIVPLLGKMMLFAIRGFRAGRDLESSFEEFIEAAEKDAKQKEATGGSQDQNDPETVKAQASIAVAQAQIQKTKLDTESEHINAQHRLAEQQMESADRQRQSESDERMAMLEFQAKQREMAMDMEFKEAQHRQRMQELSMQHAMAQQQRPVEGTP